MDFHLHLHLSLFLHFIQHEWPQRMKNVLHHEAERNGMNWKFVSNCFKINDRVLLFFSYISTLWKTPRLEIKNEERAVYLSSVWVFELKLRRTAKMIGSEEERRGKKVVGKKHSSIFEDIEIDIRYRVEREWKGFRFKMKKYIFLLALFSLWPEIHAELFSELAFLCYFTSFLLILLKLSSVFCVV